jgi:hypothetical protein
MRMGRSLRKCKLIGVCYIRVEEKRLFFENNKKKCKLLVKDMSIIFATLYHKLASKQSISTKT